MTGAGRSSTPARSRPPAKRSGVVATAWRNRRRRTACSFGPSNLPWVRPSPRARPGPLGGFRLPDREGHRHLSPAVSRPLSAAGFPGGVGFARSLPRMPSASFRATTLDHPTAARSRPLGSVTGPGCSTRRAAAGFVRGNRGSRLAPAGERRPEALTEPRATKLGLGSFGETAAPGNFDLTIVVEPPEPAIGFVRGNGRAREEDLTVDKKTPDPRWVRLAPRCFGSFGEIAAPGRRTSRSIQKPQTPTGFV
jgi:hypothetical protein